MNNILKKTKTLTLTASRYFSSNVKYFIYAFIVFLVVSSVLYGVKYIYNKVTHKIEVTTMKRPFLNVYAVKKDGTEHLINIVLVTHPFTRDECVEQYDDAKSKGVKFLGCTSYSEFPGPISNQFDVLHDPKHKAWTYDYNQICRGWLYCFRDPHKYIKPGLPMIRLTESDFSHNDDFLKDSTEAKEYDFLYVCLKDNDKCEPGWQSVIRSYEMVEKQLEIMCDKYKLKGCLVGRINCKMPKSCHNMMELTDFKPYHDFIKLYKKCKWTLVASQADASPRVASESMINNLPLFMNNNILGGWHYIKEGQGGTGEFFTEDTFENKLKLFLNNLPTYKPREFFTENYGRPNSGKKLKQFISEVFKPEELNIKLDDVDYIKPGV
jgi:hypothetical protein